MGGHSPDPDPGTGRWSSPPLLGLPSLPAASRRSGGHVLVVCRGNVCRSPAAASLLRPAMAGLGLQVRSAGVEAQVGAPADPRMTALLPGATDLAGHRAVQVDGDDVLDAGLVLCMSRRQRSAIVTSWPSLLRRCFTLREYARLVGSLPTPPCEVALAEVVDSAMARRGRVRLAEEDFDVPDPFRRPRREYRRALSLITGAVEEVAGHSRRLAG